VTRKEPAAEGERDEAALAARFWMVEETLEATAETTVEPTELRGWIVEAVDVVRELAKGTEATTAEESTAAEAVSTPEEATAEEAMDVVLEATGTEKMLSVGFERISESNLMLG